MKKIRLIGLRASDNCLSKLDLKMYIMHLDLMNADKWRLRELLTDSEANREKRKVDKEKKGEEIRDEEGEEKEDIE